MKRFIVVLLSVLLCCAVMLPVCAAETHPARVVDECGILGESDLGALSAKMDEISERHNVDVALVIVATAQDKTPEVFADDYFDYEGYGMGENDDGVMLVYFMNEGENGYVHITTHGVGIDAITDSGVEEIIDRIAPNILAGDYMTAFGDYADMCDEYIKDATTFDFLINLVISLAIGFVVAFIVTGSMKRKLKSVRSAAEANSYLKPGSLNVTEARDMFLFRQVTRTVKNTDSGSGSSTHTSSSGRTHGGGGRSL